MVYRFRDELFLTLLEDPIVYDEVMSVGDSRRHNMSFNYPIILTLRILIT